MGALVREMYPDFVETENGKRPVRSWEDYKRTSTHNVPDDRGVVSEFWVFRYALELASSLIYVQSNCNVSTSVDVV